MADDIAKDTDNMIFETGHTRIEGADIVFNVGNVGADRRHVFN